MQAYLAKRFKGLEPLIAAIILIAVTLVIAIAVVAWLTGLFGATVGGGESIVILPNASLANVNNSWQLSVSIRNTGSSSSTVVALYVANYTCTINTQTIPPGGTATITGTSCAPASALISGVRYTVKVVTAAGNTFYTEVIAS